MFTILFGNSSFFLLDFSFIYIFTLTVFVNTVNTSNLLCSRHCSKNFTWNNFIDTLQQLCDRVVVLLSSSTDKESEAERTKISHPRSQESEQGSWDLNPTSLAPEPLIVMFHCHSGPSLCKVNHREDLHSSKDCKLLEILARQPVAFGSRCWRAVCPLALH